MRVWQRFGRVEAKRAANSRVWQGISATPSNPWHRRPTYTRPFDLRSQIQKVSVTDESSVVSMTTLELTVPS